MRCLFFKCYLFLFFLFTISLSQLYLVMFLTQTYSILRVCGFLYLFHTTRTSISSRRHHWFIVLLSGCSCFFLIVIPLLDHLPILIGIFLKILFFVGFNYAGEYCLGVLVFKISTEINQWFLVFFKEFKLCLHNKNYRFF